MLSLASATRDYAERVDAGTFDRLGPKDLGRLAEPMGPDLWAWQYARRLTGQSPWRAGNDLADRIERLRAMREMTADIATWEKALACLDVRLERGRVHGERRPAPLAVPAEVRAIIDARRLVAEERASRRRNRAGDGGSGPAPVPDGTIHHPPYPPGRP